MREPLWLAGFCCLFRQLTQQARSSVSVHCGGSPLCVCFVLVALHLCVALPGLEFRNTHARPFPSPRSVSQSINHSLSTAGQRQPVCVLRTKPPMFIPAGTVSHSPSFGEAFPTAISPPKTPCPQPAPCPPTMSLPGSSPRPVVVLVLPFSLLPAPCKSPAWCWRCYYYYYYCAVISCMSDWYQGQVPQTSCPD